MEAGDLSQMVKLGEQFFAESEFPTFSTFSPRGFELSLREALADDRAVCFVFEENGKIEAFLIYQIDATYTVEPIGLLYLFYVVPEKRRSPIGRIMLSLAEGHAKANGCVAFYGGVMAGIGKTENSMRNLYTKAGYKELYWGRKLLTGDKEDV